MEIKIHKAVEAFLNLNEDSILAVQGVPLGMRNQILRDAIQILDSDERNEYQRRISDIRGEQ